MHESFETIRERFREDWKFLKGWIRKPAEVGAVKPTGKPTARAMAALVPGDSPLPVLELGPGTGVITQALLEAGIEPQRIVGIEYSRDFYGFLVERFPRVNFIHGDAFRAQELLARTPWRKFSAVIGAIPLLNVPRDERARLVESCLEITESGGPFIQITYGPRPPTPALEGRYRVEATDWIMKNVPPARIFIYRREGNHRGATD